MSKKSKEKLSRFFITLNTNISDDPHMDKKLKNAYNKFYKQLSSKGKSPFINEENPTNLKKIKVQSSVEKSPKDNKIHLHSLLSIYHDGKIKLNMNKMREFFPKELGLGNVYLNVKFVSDPEFTIGNYLKKQNKK